MLKYSAAYLLRHVASLVLRDCILVLWQNDLRPRMEIFICTIRKSQLPKNNVVDAASVHFEGTNESRMRKQRFFDFSFLGTGVLLA